jgi:hypothetical protein
MDPICWAAAAGLSLVAVYLPKLLSQPTDTARLIVTQAALFFTGALLGSFRPRRVWRWALASFFALAVRDVIAAADNPAFSHASAAKVAAYLAAHSGVYCIQALIVLLGALVGSYVLRAGLE